MSKDRLAAFMDAVLAIIMTILVLELPKPEAVTAEAIWGLRDTYLCYILSFFWLGVMWVNLHNEWHQIQVINKKVVWLGLILLFVSSWIPYSISVVNIDPGNKLGQGLYGISVLLVTFANLALSMSLYRCHVDMEICTIPRFHHILMVKYIPDIVIKLIGLALTLTVFPQAVMIAVLAAMLWIFIPVEKAIKN